MAFAVERGSVAVAKRAGARFASESVPRISDDSHRIGPAVRPYGNHDQNALVIDLFGVGLGGKRTMPFGAALDRRRPRESGAGRSEGRGLVARCTGHAADDGI